MNIKVRRRLFYCLVIVFLAGGFFVTAYSQGLRFNFSNAQWEQTGGIFLRSRPRNANIFVNGKPFSNKSGLLQNGTLIDGFFPGPYTVRLDAEGYRSWERTLTVRELLITEAKNILLIPEAEPAIEAENVGAYWNEGNFLVTQKASDGTLLQNGITLPGTMFLAWTADKQSVITKDTRTGAFFLTAAGNAPARLNLSTLFMNLKERILHLAGAVPIRTILPHPSDSKKVIMATDRALYLMDVAQLTLERIGNQAPLLVRTGGEEVWWSAKDGLHSYRFTTKQATDYAMLPSGTIEDVQRAPEGTAMGILLASGELYQYDPNTQGLLLIANKARQFSFSRDGKRIAFLDKDGKVNVFTAEKNTTGRFTVKRQAELQSLLWLSDNQHLVLVFPNVVGILEVDDAIPWGFQEIASPVRAVQYNPEQEVLYGLRAASLVRIILQK